MAMNYIELLNYLMSKDGEDLSFVQAVRNIGRIRKLDPEIKKALISFVNTGKCSHTEAGVCFTELVGGERMKPIRAFLMLDWLKREPITALKYLALRGIHADLSEVGSASISSKIEEETIDKSDIE